MTFKYHFLLLGLIVSTASCSQKSLHLEPILSANQCGFTQKQLVHISSNKQLKQLFTQSFNNPIKSLERIDFEASSIVLVSMGQQPTAGYSIKLNNSTATLTNNTLNIDAALQRPAQGNLNAQIITSPCVLYKLKKQAISEIKLTH